MTKMIDVREKPRERRFFSGDGDGDGGGAGGVRQNCSVGATSAGDWGRGIRCVGPTSGRCGWRSCSVGGSG